MLIYFKVGNYKSIKEPITLNFTASSISEHSQSNVIDTDGLSLLKTIMLYGSNASGKSKILDAFVQFRWLINNSATQKQGNEEIDVVPFLLSTETENKPCFFETSFVLNNWKYRYGIEIDREKVHKEWLLESKANAEYPLFLRIGDTYQINKKRLSEAEGLEKRTRKNALFLSVASQWNVPKAEMINQWFSNIVTLPGDPEIRHSQLTYDLLKNSKYQPLIKRIINSVDLGIQDLEAKTVPLFRKDSPSLPEKFKNSLITDDFPVVATYHTKYNEKGESVGHMPFLMENEESLGTQKFFNLLGIIIRTITENQILLIDEIELHLHPLLTKSILLLFNSGKTGSKAQLLASSHDTALLDNDILRRDQIYFIEKNQQGASEATSMVEYKIRKESPFDKNYLEGKFGAIPLIDELEDLLAHAE